MYRLYITDYEQVIDVVDHIKSEHKDAIWINTDVTNGNVEK